VIIYPPNSIIPDMILSKFESYNRYIYRSQNINKEEHNSFPNNEEHKLSEFSNIISQNNQNHTIFYMVNACRGCSIKNSYQIEDYYRIEFYFQRIIELLLLNISKCDINTKKISSYKIQSYSANNNQEKATNAVKNNAITELPPLNKIIKIIISDKHQTHNEKDIAIINVINSIEDDSRLNDDQKNDIIFKICTTSFYYRDYNTFDMVSFNNLLTYSINMRKNIDLFIQLYSKFNDMKNEKYIEYVINENKNKLLQLCVNDFRFNESDYDSYDIIIKFINHVIVPPPLPPLPPLPNDNNQSGGKKIKNKKTYKNKVIQNNNNKTKNKKTKKRIMSRKGFV